MRPQVALVIAGLVFSSIAAVAHATPVTLQNATASFTQSGCSGTWPISEADARVAPACTVTDTATAWFETSTNGNFVLTESQVDAQAVPEPATLVLFGLGLAIMATIGAKRRPRR